MKTVHIGIGKDTLSEVPKPPVYLNDQAKDHYKKMAAVLIKLNRLKESYLPALEIYSEAMAQWEFSNREIRKKNIEEHGSGYLQTYSTGATNITTEMVLRNKAVDMLWDCFKQFGLEPKSDKALKDTVDPNQTSLFEELQKKLSGA